MKRALLSLTAIAFILVSCQTDQNDLDTGDLQEIQIDMSDFSLYAEDDFAGKSAQGADKCHTMNNLAMRLDKNPALAQRMYDIEYFTRKFIAKKNANKPGNGNGGGNGNGNGNGNGGGGGDPDPDPFYTDPISIPVIVNIIEDFSGQVTQSQINSQIQVLNEDFNNTNPNTTQQNAQNFFPLVADVDITFNVAAVNRVISTRTSWGTNDAMKDSAQGGIDATNPAQFLNIWVCNIGGGILGYAQFPGGNPDTDGIVVGIDYFGSVNNGSPYNDGRTATHEVGHWLNLRHIWGDGRCNRDDFVSDTPKSDAPNYGCLGYGDEVSCRSIDMTMNYMDYTNDDCMFMFTEGQNERMRALFVPGGARESFVLVQ